MVLSVYEDFLNRKNTRNEENTDSIFYNCAGYALKTYSWWRPFFGDAPSGYEQIDELADEGYSNDEIRDIIAERCKDRVLSDFPFLEEVEEFTDNDSIIALRAGVVFEPDDNSCIDWDFHFKRKDKGNSFWTHKMGEGSIEIDQTDNIYDIWECEDDFFYSSKIFFFKDVRDNA